MTVDNNRILSLLLDLLEILKDVYILYFETGVEFDLENWLLLPRNTILMLDRLPSLARRDLLLLDFIGTLILAVLHIGCEELLLLAIFLLRIFRVRSLHIAYLELSIW